MRLAMKAWRPETSGVLGIVCAALVLRLVFAVGFVGGYPQDDSIYVTVARSIVHGGPDLGRYQTISSNLVVNPAEIFAFRVGYIYPLALFFRLFGEGDSSAIWPALLSSLACIVVTAGLAAELFGWRVALCAALLLATLPHDILLSTRVLADAPVGLWSAAGALALFVGLRTAQVRYFTVCGAACGIAYLVKDTGIVRFLIAAAVVAGHAIEKKQWSVIGAYVTGFLACMFLEGAWYQAKTGHFFLHPLIAHSVSVYKYTREPTFSLVALPLLRVEWVEEFFLIGAVLLGFAKETYEQFSGFGLTYWVAAAGLVWTAISPPDPRARVLAAFAVLVYLYLECGPVGVAIDRGTVVYRGIYKHLRYVSALNPLAMPFAGLMLGEIWRRHRGLAVGDTGADRRWSAVAAPRLQNLEGQPTRHAGGGGVPHVVQRPRVHGLPRRRQSSLSLGKLVQWRAIPGPSGRSGSERASRRLCRPGWKPRNRSALGLGPEGDPVLGT